MSCVLGQNAIVIGGSGGIGLEICRDLARQGAYVYVHYFRSKDSAEKALLDIKAEGGSGEIIGFDICCGEDVERKIRKITEQRKIDILVNGAGVIDDELFINMNERHIKNVFEVNFFGPIDCIQAVLPGMIKQRYGRIVNISSAAVKHRRKGQANYIASKAALNAFTRSLALEVAKVGITVNAVAPGLVETGMTQDFISQFQGDVFKTIPMGRAATPQEIASCVTFLCSERSSYVSGEVLTVDGGGSNL